MVEVGTLVGPDGVAPSQMVSVSASVNLPLHHSPEVLTWVVQEKRAVKRLWCGGGVAFNAFILLVGHQEEHLACKIVQMICIWST